jgi:signal transduction histidine kinase
MRLALKFVVVLTVWIALVLGVQASLHVARIAEFQEREIRDDLVSVGEALAAATGDLWEAAGKDAALHYVGETNARRGATALSVRMATTADRVSVAQGEVIHRLSRREHWHITASLPVVVEGKIVAVLDLRRQLPNERDYLQSIRSTQVAATILATLISGLLVLGLGMRLIGHPIRRLASLAHRVAEGDFTQRTFVRQRDEIGDLAKELERMSARLAESHDKVQDERKARTEALEQLRHADRLSTVGKLASSLAHELGTPLNVVSGRANLIVAEPGATEQSKSNARIVVEQCQRMATIIREMLDFSRRKPLQRTRVVIGDVLQHAIALMEPVAEDKGVVLHTDVSDQLSVDVDASKLMQVLTNLMDNAISAMPNGGTLSLHAEPEHVSEPPDRHARGGEFIRIDVDDEGVGIPEDGLLHIFEPFFTTKGQGQGTGLGLSVCHGIVREHGGFIQVTSREGEGTCFSVYLPQGYLPEGSPA